MNRLAVFLIIHCVLHGCGAPDALTDAQATDSAVMASFDVLSDQPTASIDNPVAVADEGPIASEDAPAGCGTMGARCVSDPNCCAGHMCVADTCVRVACTTAGSECGDGGACCSGLRCEARAGQPSYCCRPRVGGMLARCRTTLECCPGQVCGQTGACTTCQPAGSDCRLTPGLCCSGRCVSNRCM